ncbi:MAG: hypothetical protein ACPGVG_16725 [Mycobacterium sp.]
MRTLLRSLTDPDHHLELPSDAWGRIRLVARRTGWRPAGTQPPSGAQGWLGNYDGHQGEEVTARDAGQLAATLRRLEVSDFAEGDSDLALNVMWLAEAGPFSINRPAMVT